jgi:hypothetical protein
MPFFLHVRPDLTIETLESCLDADSRESVPEPISSHAFLQQRQREINLACGSGFGIAVVLRQQSEALILRDISGAGTRVDNSPHQCLASVTKDTFGGHGKFLTGRRLLHVDS